MKTEPISACLVLLTDSLYLPGTQATLEHWDRHNPRLPAIALSTDKSILNDPFLVNRCEMTLHVDPSNYDRIGPYKKRRSMRHGQTFFKFEAFSDFGYERNIYLDSDILCLGPAPLLLTASSAQLQAAPDTGFRKTRAYKGHANEINTGVLAIHRTIQGEETIDQLKTIARENPGRGGYNAGDQGIINKWIHQQSIDIELLSSDYNLLKKDYEDLSDLETCRLLHFAAGKPWIPRTRPDGSPAPSPPLVRFWQRHCQSPI